MNTCDTVGCSAKAECKGKCGKHYMQHRRSQEEVRPCGCGCGAMTRRAFAPGHATRAYSIRHDTLTAAKLRALLAYNPNTGVFTALAKTANRRPAGSVTGWVDANGYIRVGVYGKGYKAHRLAVLWVEGVWPSEVDQTTNLQNRYTAAFSSISGLLGAWPTSDGRRWTSSIRFEGAVVPLGNFSTAEEAHAAYIKAKRELHPGGNL